jgi:two-component system, OmpR family, phosphate regulon response regulator PhoB
VSETSSVTETVASEAGQLIVIAQHIPAATASLAYHLARAGYNVTTASDASEVLKLVRAKPHDLLVLDPALRDPSGYELLEELRRDEKTRDLGIILVSSDAAALDGIRGLSLGADDCLSAPISPAELVLRVAAILRRRGAAASAEGRRLRAGPIVVDRAAHRVTVDGGDVPVTITEFKLLTALIQQEGRVLSRQHLLESVWQTKSKVQTRTVDMHLQRLRRKLGPVGECIKTVRGAGYRLETGRNGDQSERYR